MVSLLRLKCRSQKAHYQGYPSSVCFVMKVVSQNFQFQGQYLCLFVFIFINNTQDNFRNI